MLKCPFCNSTFEFNPDDKDITSICKFCNKRFFNDLNLRDFLNRNANLFVIMGVFAAIALLLPQIAGNNLIAINKWIQGSVSINDSPLSILIPNQELFIALSILLSWFLMLSIGIMIISDIFENRKDELIWYENSQFTFRNGDLFRFFFVVPFVLLGISLTLYILSLFWNLFQFFEILFIIFMVAFFIFFVTQNPEIIKKIKDNP